MDCQSETVQARARAVLAAQASTTGFQMEDADDPATAATEWADADEVALLSSWASPSGKRAKTSEQEKRHASEQPMLLTLARPKEASPVAGACREELRADPPGHNATASPRAQGDVHSQQRPGWLAPVLSFSIEAGERAQSAPIGGGVGGPPPAPLPCSDSPEYAPPLPEESPPPPLPDSPPPDGGPVSPSAAPAGSPDPPLPEEPPPPLPDQEEAPGSGAAQPLYWNGFAAVPHGGADAPAAQVEPHRLNGVPALHHYGQTRDVQVQQAPTELSGRASPWHGAPPPYALPSGPWDHAGGQQALRAQGMAASPPPPMVGASGHSPITRNPALASPAPGLAGPSPLPAPLPLPRFRPPLGGPAGPGHARPHDHALDFHNGMAPPLHEPGRGWSGSGHPPPPRPWPGPQLAPPPAMWHPGPNSAPPRGPAPPPMWHAGLALNGAGGRARPPPWPR